jgi:hypothetical protein
LTIAAGKLLKTHVGWLQSTIEFEGVLAKRQIGVTSHN